MAFSRSRRKQLKKRKDTTALGVVKFSLPLVKDSPLIDPCFRMIQSFDENKTYAYR